MTSAQIDRDTPVLVAEGSPIHSSALKEYLSDFQFQNIQFVKDGFELKSAAETESFGLILVGDSLSRTNSLQAINAIRKSGKNQDTPIIFLYDKNIDKAEKAELLHDMIAEGASATHEKPVDKKLLRGTIEDLLGRLLITTSEYQTRSKESLTASLKAIELANSLRDSGDFQQAESSYIDTILNVFFGMAEMYLFMEDKESSDRILREASFIDSEAPSKFLSREREFAKRGFRHIAEKHFELAKYEFNAAYLMNAESVLVHVGLGETLLALGQEERALEWFTQALNLKPRIEDRSVYKRLGGIAFNLKEYNLSVQAYETALSFIQSDPEIYYHQSLVFVAQWKFSEALDRITVALRLNPEFHEALKVREKIREWIKSHEMTKEKPSAEAI